MEGSDTPREADCRDVEVFLFTLEEPRNQGQGMLADYQAVLNHGKDTL
jgi:hypothetical protein